MNLNNKVAVVTGGASGLGRAAAQALVERGATVVIFDMNARRARLRCKSWEHQRRGL